MTPLVMMWTVDPVVVPLAVAAAYVSWRGWSIRRAVGVPVAGGGALAAPSAVTGQAPASRVPRGWQVVLAGVGLIVLVADVCSPLNALARQYYVAQMVQNEILLFAVAPLLLLGAPVLSLWQILPAQWRVSGRAVALRQPSTRRAWEMVGHTISTPQVAWLAFIGGFLVWHVEQPFDLAQSNGIVHELERLFYLGAALLFWAQVVPSRPVRRRLTYPEQAVYIGAAGLVLHGFAFLTATSAAPFYSFYLRHASGGAALSAVADQTSAGAMLDAGGCVILAFTVMALVGLWLGEDEPAGGGGPRGGVPVQPTLVTEVRWRRLPSHLRVLSGAGMPPATDPAHEDDPDETRRREVSAAEETPPPRRGLTA